MGKKFYSIGSCDMKTMFHCSVVMFFVGGFVTLSFYRNNNLDSISSNTMSTITTMTKPTITTENENTNINTNTRVLKHQRRLKIAPPPLTDTCDLCSGRWVHDNRSRYPLYKEDECPYLLGDVACLTYGRKDSKYQQWRWQPHGCDFPRFDGKAIVERLKGKRLLFVGDSINRNQWDSMMCMLHLSIPGIKKVKLGGTMNHTMYTFRAIDYNISIDYYWAPMLVESNGDNPIHHSLPNRTIRINSIEKHARHWVDADILVFNSYMWWKFPIIYFLKSAGSLLGGPNQVYDEVDHVRAYKKALETWSKWVRINIDPAKTKIFFMGLTATHSRPKDWGGKKLKCYNETEPVLDDGFWESGTDLQMLRILRSSLSKLKAEGANVQLINITKLTQGRKDAHPTVHKKLWSPLTDAPKKSPKHSLDCTHWCLPGVPDIWNEILLAYIFPENKTPKQG